MEFLKRSKFYMSILLIGMLYLLFTGTPSAQTTQLTNEEIWSEIQRLKAEIAQLKDQIAKLRAEVESLKGVPTIEVPSLKKGQVPLNKVFRKIPGWKVTLASYEILEGGGIKFNFVIENLQDKPADFRFYSQDSRYTRERRPYILDDQTNKYFNPQISPRDRVTLIPNMPVEGYISFTQSELGKTKVIVFYFGFGGLYIEGNRWNETGTLYVGPIKLR